VLLTITRARQIRTVHSDEMHVRDSASLGKFSAELEESKMTLSMKQRSVLENRETLHLAPLFDPYNFVLYDEDKVQRKTPLRKSLLESRSPVNVLVNRYYVFFSFLSIKSTEQRQPTESRAFITEIIR